MKSIINRFRESLALDDPARSHTEDSAVARDAESAFQKLDAHLSAVRGNPPDVAPAVHNSIMRAVRAAGQPEPRDLSYAWTWFAAPATAVLLAVAGWWVFKPAQPPAKPAPAQLADLSWTFPGAALELGDNVPITLPTTLVSPLAQEWALLRRDLDRTTEFLLANVPQRP